LNPGLEVSNDLFREFFLRRHLQAAMLQGRDQQTLANPPRHNRRTGLTTSPKRRPAVDSQTTFDFGRSRRMTRVTLTDQHRTDSALEKLGALPIIGL
jgi:hypothetical protein